MKALRELLAKGTPGEWAVLSDKNRFPSTPDTEVVRLDRGVYDMVCKTQQGTDAHLIAAMHNALPELLKEAEMFQAWNWAEMLVRGDCAKCPFFSGMGNECGDQCDNIWNHKSEWLSAWRDAQKIEGVE